MGVTVGGLNLEDTFLNGEEGDIESTTSKIEDEDVLLLSGLLVKTVGNGSGGWLVDDSKNLDTSDLTSILGGLSLLIVEVSWDGNNSLVDFLTTVLDGNFLHLGEDHGGDFLSLELLDLILVVNDDHWSSIRGRLDLEWPELDVILDGLVMEVSSDESLGIENSVEWVSSGLILG